MEKAIIAEILEELKSLVYTLGEPYIHDTNPDQDAGLVGDMKLLYRAKTETEFKNASKTLLNNILRNLGEDLHIVYENPKIWFNFALDSKSSLKTAELARWKEGFIYSSDESRKRDALSILNIIISDMFFLKKESNILDDGDYIWKAAYEDENEFYGRNVAGELWLEMMPADCLRDLKIEFQNSFKKTFIPTPIPKNSYLANDLIVLAMRLAKEYNMEHSRCDKITFKNTGKDGNLIFYNSDNSRLISLNMEKIIDKINPTILQTSKERKDFLFAEIYKEKKNITFQSRVENEGSKMSQGLCI